MKIKAIFGMAAALCLSAVAVYAQLAPPMAPNAPVPAVVAGPFTAGDPVGANAFGQVVDSKTNSIVNLSSIGLSAGITAASVTLPGTGYVPGDTIVPTITNSTLAAPTGLSYLGSPVLLVANTQVVSATVAAAGTGCTNGTQTVTGTTGTGGGSFFFTASVTVAGNAITAVNSITAGGQYQVNPTTLAAEPVTGASCTGSQLNVVMGVLNLSVQNPGSYSSVPKAGTGPATQSSTSGAGTGATFSVNFGAQAAYVIPTNQTACGAAQFGNGVCQQAFNFSAGFQALGSVTTANQATAFGWNAGASDTTGNSLTAFGSNALGASTTAANNTAVGRDAMRNYTTGTQNTAVGSQAGTGVSSGATGSQNVFVGFNTGAASTTAGSNTIVGYNAGAAVTTGGNSVYIGSIAGQSITTAGGNTAVGAAALSSATNNAATNTALGRSAGAAVTSGGPNTILGANVGSATLTTASNVVLIGTTNNTDSNTSNSIHVGAGAADVWSATGTGTPSTAASTINGTLTLPNIATDATHTDATLCEDTTTHTLLFGSGAAGICLGTSSARYKHGIADLTEGLPQIMALKPKQYYLNADHGDPGKLLFGFVAEDGISALPQLVGLDDKGRPNTFDLVGVVPVLVHAMQEMQAEISALKSRLAVRSIEDYQRRTVIKKVNGNHLVSLH